MFPEKLPCIEGLDFDKYSEEDVKDKFITPSIKNAGRGTMINLDLNFILLMVE